MEIHWHEPLHFLHSLGLGSVAGSLLCSHLNQSRAKVTAKLLAADPSIRIHLLEPSNTHLTVHVGWTSCFKAFP